MPTPLCAAQERARGQQSLPLCLAAFLQPQPALANAGVTGGAKLAARRENHSRYLAPNAQIRAGLIWPLEQSRRRRRSSHGHDGAHDADDDRGERARASLLTFARLSLAALVGVSPREECASPLLRAPADVLQRRPDVAAAQTATGLAYGEPVHHHHHHRLHRHHRLRRVRRCETGCARLGCRSLCCPRQLRGRPSSLQPPLLLLLGVHQAD